MRPLPSPDLAGFAEAQHRLREAFGEPVTFVREASITFPPGASIDPETGAPFDPLIAGSAVSASASGIMNVAWRSRDKEVEIGAAGFVERDHVMLIGDPAASGLASGAREFTVRGETFDITATKGDQLGSGHVADRFLVYGRRRQ